MNICVKEAFKEYGGRRVLDIDALNIEEGHVYAILGLNGSGKSTLIECISGINSLDGGIILYNNQKDISAVRDCISTMVQKPYIFDMSAIDNIKIGLKFRKYEKEKIAHRVGKYIQYFNIKDLLYKNARSLSGGESQKVALLRTAVLETEVTLLDEPTSSMDIESTLCAEELIKDMSGNGRTVIMVTHDLYQAKRIADHVIFMDKGRIIEMGDKTSVLNNPRNSLVKLVLNM